MHYCAGFKILLIFIAAELNLVLRKSMTSASRVALVVKRLAAFLFSLVFQMMLSVLAMNQTTGSCSLSSTLKSRRMTWAGVRFGDYGMEMFKEPVANIGNEATIE